MATVLERDPERTLAERAAPGRTSSGAAPLQSRCEQIVDAANELLNEEGLDGLTIRAVLKRSGLARRAFYECFASKDDLVLAVFERAIASSASHFAQSGARTNALEAIGGIVLGIVLGPMEAGAGTAINRRSTSLSREHLRLGEARPQDLDRALRPLIDLLTALVQRGMAEGDLRQGDADLTARLIYNLVATTTHADLLTPGGSGTPEHFRMTADAVWGFCRHAIAA